MTKDYRKTFLIIGLSLFCRLSAAPQEVPEEFGKVISQFCEEASTQQQLFLELEKCEMIDDSPEVNLFFLSHKRYSLTEARLCYLANCLHLIDEINERGEKQKFPLKSPFKWENLNIVIRFVQHNQEPQDAGSVSVVAKCDKGICYFSYDSNSQNYYPIRSESLKDSLNKARQEKGVQILSSTGSVCKILSSQKYKSYPALIFQTFDQLCLPKGKVVKELFNQRVMLSAVQMGYIKKDEKVVPIFHLDLQKLDSSDEELMLFNVNMLGRKTFVSPIWFDKNGIAWRRDADGKDFSFPNYLDCLDGFSSGEEIHFLIENKSGEVLSGIRIIPYPLIASHFGGATIVAHRQSSKGESYEITGCGFVPDESLLLISESENERISSYFRATHEGELIMGLCPEVKGVSSGMAHITIIRFDNPSLSLSLDWGREKNMAFQNEMSAKLIPIDAVGLRSILDNSNERAGSFGGKH